MTKKILIIGNLENPHLTRLIYAINSYRKSTQRYSIEGFSFRTNVDHKHLREIGYQKVYIRREYFPSFIYKLPKIRFVFSIIDYLISFSKVQGSFSAINIHYLTIESFFLYSLYIKKASKIILTPWGSDVYRIPRFYLFFFKYIYNKVDYVTIPEIKFRKDIVTKFTFKTNKIIDLGFGSTIIDMILNNPISREKAQELIGLKDRFIITCGYNASSKQQHIKIIESLCKIREKLPDNLLLIFLMTYNEEVPGYIMKVESILKQTNFQYLIYRKYVDDNFLFYIQRSTNIFIHIQKTDAFSAFVQENILCENIVINGKWLRYPQLEIGTIPYYLLDSIDDLDAAIVELISKKDSIIISTATKNYISQNSWSILGKKWHQFFESI